MIFLIKLFMEKSTLAASLALLLLAMGIFAGFHLDIRQSPRIDFPVIQITTEWPGASAEMISASVTTLLQEALSGIDNVDYMTAQSRAGISEIKLYFKPGYTEGAAIATIHARLSSAKNTLPDEVQSPSIQKLSADNRPAMIIAFTSQAWTRLQVADFLRRSIKPSLEFIQGISQAEVLGESYALSIALDPMLLQAHQVTANEVAMMMRQKYFLSGLGIKKSRDEEHLIQLSNTLSLPNTFANMMLPIHPGQWLTLADIAQIRFGSADSDVSAYYNGKSTTMIFIRLSPGANPLTVAEYVKQTLQHIVLPKEIQAHIVFDSSQYIYASLREVSETIFLAFIIISLVTIFSLGNVRLAIVPLTAIPLSLAAACCFLWWLHGSCNSLTLLAAVLSIGLVVDDAIIIIENVHRHLRHKPILSTAILQATHEIIGPILSMSFILTAIYLPLMMMGGLSGNYFKEFAFVLSISVLLSAVVAFFISPWMSLQLLRTGDQRNTRLIFYTDCIFQWIHQVYEKLLRYIYCYRFYFVFLILLSIPLSGWFYGQLPKELAPKEDQGFLQVIGHSSYDIDAQRIDSMTRRIESNYHTFPEINRSIRINNIPEKHEYLSYIGLLPWEQRRKPIEWLQQQLQKQLNSVSELQSIVILPPALPNDGGLPVEYVLKGTLDGATLLQVAKAIQSDAEKSGLFRWLEIDTQYNHHDLMTVIDRPLAAWLGVDIAEVARNMRWLFGKENFSWFLYHGRSYPIVLHTQNESLDLNQIQIRNREGNLIPLSTIAHFEPALVLNHYDQFQKMPSVMLSGILSPGHYMNEGLQWLDQARNKFSDHRILSDYAGESREFMSDYHHQMVLFILSLCMIWLVLTIQFESFRTPLVIILGCLPLTFFAVLSTMWVSHMTCNIYSEIALLTLAGLMSKQGILMLDFAKKLRRSQSINSFSAIQQAALLRFRPILMTSASMLFSALPLIFTKGPGAHSRYVMGLVIVSGVLFGTFVTLVFLPACYCVLEKLNHQEE